MVIHCDVVLYKLLDDGIIVVVHLSFFCVIACDELLGLLGRELIVGGSEDGKYLAAVECLVVATALNNLSEVAQIAVLLNGLPECSVAHAFTFIIIVIVPGVRTGRKGEGSYCQPYHLIIYFICNHNS